MKNFVIRYMSYRGENSDMPYIDTDILKATSLTSMVELLSTNGGFSIDSRVRKTWQGSPKWIPYHAVVSIREYLL